MIVEPLTIEHYRALVVQPAQRYIGGYVDESSVVELVRQPSFAGIINGDVVGMAGMYELGSGRAGVWALLGSDAGDHMLSVHKAVSRFLSLQTYRRIEATVEYDFAAGHRWVKMLGFTLEAARMKNYDPDGRDHTLYAKVC